MEYLNFDVEIESKREDHYLVVARSESGGARHQMRFPLEDRNLEIALLQVEIALLRAGQIRRGAGTSEEKIVQEFGQTLFEVLLAGDVRRLYDLSRTNQHGKGLRIRLQIQPPELAKLPWEFLYDPLQQEYLCFLPDTVIVRYLEGPHVLLPFTVEPPLQVLAIIADPNDQERLDMKGEQQRLVGALNPLVQRNLVKLHWVEGQTANDLHQALLQREYHILHYIGHGGFDPRSQEGVLALANEQGRSELLSAIKLARMLERRHSLRLVVLNSCQGAMGNQHDRFSSTAAMLASKGTPAVLAMQYEITDQAAINFTRGFYGALAAGMPVDEAVAEARTAISLGAARTLEWVTPVLYLRSPTGLLFRLPQHETDAVLLSPIVDLSSAIPSEEPARESTTWLSQEVQDEELVENPSSPLPATSREFESTPDPDRSTEIHAAPVAPNAEVAPSLAEPLIITAFQQGNAPVLEQNYEAESITSTAIPPADLLEPVLLSPTTGFTDPLTNAEEKVDLPLELSGEHLEDINLTKEKTSASSFREDAISIVKPKASLSETLNNGSEPLSSPMQSSAGQPARNGLTLLLHSTVLRILLVSVILVSTVGAILIAPNLNKSARQHQSSSQGNTPMPTATSIICSIGNTPYTPTFIVADPVGLLNHTPEAQQNFDAQVTSLLAEQNQRQVALSLIYGGGTDVPYGLALAQAAREALGGVNNFSQAVFQTFGDLDLNADQIAMSMYPLICAQSRVWCTPDIQHPFLVPAFTVDNPAGLLNHELKAQDAFDAQVTALFAGHNERDANTVQIFGGGNTQQAGKEFAKAAGDALQLLERQNSAFVAQTQFIPDWTPVINSNQITITTYFCE